MDRGFRQGLAYAVAWLLKAHDQESIALELLQHSGYKYADLKAVCDPYDLEPIAKALGLQLDGNPCEDCQ